MIEVAEDKIGRRQPYLRIAALIGALVAVVVMVLCEHLFGPPSSGGVSLARGEKLLFVDVISLVGCFFVLSAITFPLLPKSFFSGRLFTTALGFYLYYLIFLALFTAVPAYHGSSALGSLVATLMMPFFHLLPLGLCVAAGAVVLTLRKEHLWSRGQTYWLLGVMGVYGSLNALPWLLGR